MKHIFTIAIALMAFGAMSAQKYKNHIIPFEGMKGKVKSYEQTVYTAEIGSYGLIEKKGMDKYNVCEFDQNGFVTHSQSSENPEGPIIQELQNKIVNNTIVEIIDHQYIPEDVLYKTIRVSRKDDIEKWTSSYQDGGPVTSSSFTCEYLPRKKIWTDDKTKKSDIQIFDTNGYLTIRSFCEKDKIKDQYKYKYDKDGFVSEIEMTISDFKPANGKQTFKYDIHDSYGNWKRRLTYDKQGTLIELVEQEIEYWE